MKKQGKASDAFAFVDQSPDERPSVAEQVADRLLELIRSGELRPGDQLPSDRDLATMMEVSQPTVREALRGLQILGAIRWQRNDACYVSSLELTDMLAPLQFLITQNVNNIEALYQARIVIDGGIGRMAASRISEAAIARLHEIIALQETQINDLPGFMASDQEFHRIILDACANPLLDQVGNSFYMLGMEYSRITFEASGLLTQSVRDHVAILDGLVARDPARTGAAMEEHMRHVDRATRKVMTGLETDDAN